MTEYKEIEIKKIKPNPRQPREHIDKKKLEELAESIREVGVLNPIQVRPKDDAYEMISGQRRLLASKMLKKDKIPALIKGLNDDQLAVESLIENVHREDLTDEEKAKALLSIMKKEGLKSHAEVAKRVGLHRNTVTDIVAAYAMRKKYPKELKQASITRIRATDGFPEKERVRIIKQSQKLGISARKLEEKVIPLIKKSPEHIKEALITGKLNPEEVEQISDLTEREQVKLLGLKKTAEKETNVGDLKKLVLNIRRMPTHEGVVIDSDKAILNIQSGCLTVSEGVKQVFALKSIKDWETALDTIRYIETAIKNLESLKKWLEGFKK
jgi:ParB family chromosome partitioning protein